MVSLTNPNLCSISVIIPTFNRPNQLVKVLHSLVRQNFPFSAFEVLVVDDGSQMAYSEIIERSWPFEIKYLFQENQGEAVARNYGVNSSQADFLVFLDDDMEVEPQYLEALYQEHLVYPAAILVGTMYQKSVPDSSLYQKITASHHQYTEFGEVAFTNILGGVMAISKTIYVAIGQMQPIPDKKRGGWMDLAFAWRAHQAGYSLRRCEKAVVFHDDSFAQNLEIASQRIYRDAYLAPQLFDMIPDLKDFMPMFKDKEPIKWMKEPIPLIIRKFLRRCLSNVIIVFILKALVALLEEFAPKEEILTILYRWIIGASIYRGYQEGLSLSKIDLIKSLGQ